MRDLETDYLVVGAGAAGMAFANLEPGLAKLEAFSRRDAAGSPASVR